MSDSLVPPPWPSPDRTVPEDFADAESVPEAAGAGFVVAVGAQPSATDTIISNPQYAILDRNSITTSLALFKDTYRDKF
jgi:hypothetical protein